MEADLAQYIRDAVDNHEVRGWKQWYTDEFCIDCDADEFWEVVAKAIREYQEGKVNGTPDLSPIMTAMGSLPPEEEVNPAVDKRQAQIAVHDEMIEAQKKFHLKTAAYVMSLDHYKRIRAALSEPGQDVEDPDDPWHPVQGDMFMGYPIMVVDEEGNPPHIELVEKDLRPSYYAGVTSLGIERKDMKEPEFPAASMETADEAPATESVDPGLEDAAAEEDDSDDPFLSAP